MPDLLTHAFIAYAVCTGLSWHWEWITPAYATVGMAGAFIPDLAKVDLLVPDAAVEAALGVPYSWFTIHTFGGSMVAIVVGVVLVAASDRHRVAGLLTLGAGSHLLADAMLLKPTGLAAPMAWPLTRIYPPSPGLYHSTDPWPAVVTGMVAVLVWLVTWYRRSRSRDEIP